MDLEYNEEKYLDELKSKWLKLQSQPKVFSYTLRVDHSKYLAGKHRFYAELNAKRAALRRTPQIIYSLDPTFNAEQFNFTKIQPRELLMTIPYKGSTISIIINNSPLTPFHSLICPDRAACLPQRMTFVGLSFSVTLLRHLKTNAFRIGYNSPGALASLNHLHLHLLYIEKSLYIDDAKLELISNYYIYRLTKDMPTEGICYLIHQSDSESELEAKLRDLMKFLDWLCEKNLPHNLFFSLDRSEEKDSLKIFIFARTNYCVIRDLRRVHIGFCEMCGFVPVPCMDQFHKLKEKDIIEKIHEETGQAYNPIYDYFQADL